MSELNDDYGVVGTVVGGISGELAGAGTSC